MCGQARGLSLRLMAACEGRSGGEDEAAVGVWGNPRNPLNPRQSAIQTRKGGDGPLFYTCFEMDLGFSWSNRRVGVARK